MIPFHKPTDQRGLHAVLVPHARGFTLTELLIVIGIIVLIAALALPMITRARRGATKARIQADLQTIGVAIDAFKADHGDIPRVNLANAGFGVLGRELLGMYGNGLDNSATPALDPEDPPVYSAGETYSVGDTVRAGNNVDDLTWVALVDAPTSGPPTANPPGTTTVSDDWAQVDANDPLDGPGSKSARTNRKSGPYLQDGKFRTRGLAILDINDQPILYFPSRPTRATLNRAAAYLPAVVTSPTYAANDDAAQYDAFDNWSLFRRADDPDNQRAQWRIHAMLGDLNVDGGINVNPTDEEEAKSDKAYLLWSAGVDRLYGPSTITNGGAPADRKKNAAECDRCDDATNFR